MHALSSTMVLWARPVALSIHVVEEFAIPGGFVRWIERYNQRRLKRARYYVAVNAAAIALSVALAFWAKEPVGYWVFLYSVALMAGNAVSHVRAALQQKRCCPGMVSGVLLFIPLLVLGGWRFIGADVVRWPFAAIGIIMGLIVGLFLFPVDTRHQEAPDARPRPEHSG